MENQLDYAEFGRKVLGLLDEARSESKPDGDCGVEAVCPAESCVRSEESGHEIVSAYLNRTVDELREELKAEKELNRKLWVVIAEARMAIGIAWGTIPSDDPAWNGFNDKSKYVARLLNDIVPLTPAGGTDAG